MGAHEEINNFLGCPALKSCVSVVVFAVHKTEIVSDVFLGMRKRRHTWECCLC